MVMIFSISYVGMGVFSVCGYIKMSKPGCFVARCDG